MAQQFYKKPVSMGGGGNDFTNFAIPTNLVTTANGSYALSGAGTSSITITGTPTTGQGYSWTVVTTVTPTSISTVVN